MVFNNSFLIVEVSPANNELSVPVNRSISVRFSTDMDINTITNGTLLLHVVNGDAVACSVTYERTNRTAHVKPDVLLSQGTQYRLSVVGGDHGVKTIVGTVLDQAKNFEFVTTGDFLITAPQNLTTNVTGQKVSIAWLQPDQYDPAKPPEYEVFVSTSNLDPDQDLGAVVWPLASDAICSTTQTSIAVGRELVSGNYYVYVRGITEKQKGSWASTQIYIAPVAVGGGGGTPGGGTTIFEARETYPKADAVNMLPTTVKVLFTSNLNMTTVNSQTVYILKKKKPEQITIIDLMTEWAPANGIPYTIDANTPANLLSLTVNPTVFSKNTEYTIVLREGIKDVSGNVLGESYYWSFTSQYDPLFGDPDEIKEDIKGFITSISDKVLYSYMAATSQIALDIVRREGTLTGVFDEVAFLESPPSYMGQYVRAKAAYDLLVTAFLERSSSAGSVRVLGELTIDNSKSPDITKILVAFKDRIQHWEDELHGLHNRGYAKPVIAVKGETGAVYPVQYTRDFKTTEV